MVTWLLLFLYIHFLNPPSPSSSLTLHTNPKKKARNQTSMESQYSTHETNSAKEEDCFSWMDISSRDPLYSSLEIVPKHNQYLLPESFTNSPADDFANVYGIGEGGGEEDGESESESAGYEFQNQHQKSYEFQNQNQEEKVEEKNMEKDRAENGNGGGSSNTSKMMLTRETISKYFYMPITQAAKELNVGLTWLKKRCRQLGICRWPHRKLMSLQTLINNVQELGKESGERAEGKLREAVLILERERKKMEEIPDLQLEHNTTRLRQACFKAKYKKKRNIGVVSSSTSLGHR